MKGLEHLALVAIAALSVLINGCNLTGGLDHPDSSKDEILAEAQADMDQGNCSLAAEKLGQISEKDDRVYQMLGWAQLCVGSATINKVGKTLFSYNSSSNNLTVVGALANNLIGASQGNIDSASAAITTFSRQSAGNDKAFNQAFGNIVKAALIIARRSGDGVRVRQSDISPGVCANQNCASAPAGCSAGLSDADATAVLTTINEASTAVSTSSGLGITKELADHLTAIFGGSVAGNAIRCAIFNNMISAN